MNKIHKAIFVIHFGAFACRALAQSGDSVPLALSPFDVRQASELQQHWAKQIGRELTHKNSIGMKMVLLPPGEFTMGRTEEQFDELLKFVENDPKMHKHRGGFITWSMLMMPAHRVRLTKPFYMGATEVTVGQFRKFVEATHYKTEAERGLVHGKPYKGRRPLSTWRKPMAWRKPPLKQHDEEPVIHLCWNDCVAFCEWLSKAEGVEYALPTEAEWEYACRAGSTTPWSFGGFASDSGKYAIWSDGGQKFDRPQRVAQRQPNAFGLYDMHGNMWEYVADWWHRLSYKDAPLNDPTGPELQSEKNDQRRIIRGSSFDWGRWGGDSAYRMRITQRSNQHPHMSFRVVMRIQNVKGVSPAVEPDLERRKQRRDPGVGSEQVKAALKAGRIQKKLEKELTIELARGVEMPFVLIPAGSFLMGSEKGSYDERPLHRVVVSKPFFMARYELTQSQWEAVMGKHKWLSQLTDGDNRMSGPTKAMNVLSWNDCQKFISKLKKKVPEYSFSLPTEAQWEYACRAGSTTEFHFGDDPGQLTDYAWFQGNMNWPGQPGFQGKAFYHDVGEKKPNSWGLFDMHGGVWEWCADRYNADYYFVSELVDPVGPKDGRFRVLRGGSWFRYAKYTRSGYRRFFHPEGSSGGVTAWINDFGCRLVINLDEDSQPARTTQERGRNLPQVQLAENLVKYEANPLLDVGKKGDWDEKNCGCFSVDQFNGRLHLYYMGSGNHNSWRIGLAKSDDGIHWQRQLSNPVLSTGNAGSWDDRAVSMPYIVNDGKSLCMIYSGSGKGGGFGLAMSADGVNWTRHGKKPLLRGIGGSMDPCLRKIDGQYSLWYCGKQGGSYRIFHATSADGIKWTKHRQPVLPLGGKGDFDEASHAGPVVLKVEDVYYLFYIGGSSQGWKAGLATSMDGIHWTKSPANPILNVGGKNDWDGGSILSIDALWMKDRFHIWYAAHSMLDAGKPESEQTIRIGHAVSNLQLP